MLTKKQLISIDIHDWESIAEEFIGSDLLLGNGFSMNLTGAFNYGSLFEEFLKNCEATDADLFRRFDSTNFELIMQRLINAKSVNGIFGIDTSRIEDALQKLRSGLVLAIQNNHPRSDRIAWEQLEGIATQLVAFNDIFTLNYDLFIYHIIMIMLDMHRADRSVRPYNDYFWLNFDSQFLQFMDFQDIPKYKHIYYLHGALFLFKRGHNDLKIRRSERYTELVGLIANNIEEGEVPLFVSEGTADDKLLAISSSNYLRFALSKLKAAENRIVIFGTSLSEPDQHVVDAINRNSRKLAVSVYVGNKSQEALISQIYQLRSRFPKHEIAFFDSSTLFEF
jgi:hypothetical protein